MYSRFHVVVKSTARDLTDSSNVPSCSMSAVVND